MGFIRKTASIATIGLVNFRSKGERLARAEAELEEARADYSSARAGRDRHAAAAERAQRRAAKSERRALSSKKQAKRERRRADRSGESRIQDAGDAAVVAGRRARRKLKRQAGKIDKAARKAG